jgi:hypothetical protein
MDGSTDPGRRAFLRGVVAVSVAGGALGTAKACAPTAPDGGEDTVPGERRARTGLNIRDFGAKGDGDTDDSAAIRSALARGGAVDVPEGTFLVSKDPAGAYAIDVPGGARISGVGTIRLADGQAQSVRVLRLAEDDVSIDGVTLDGNTAGQSVVENLQRHGIFSAAKQVRLTDVRITGCAGDGIQFTAGTSDVRLASVRIDDCDRNAITFYADTEGEVVENVSVSGCHLECRVQPLDCEPVAGIIRDIRVVGTYAMSTGGSYSVTVSGSSGSSPLTGYVLSGNTLVGSVSVVNAERCIISDNLIDGRSGRFPGVDASYHSRDIVVANNTIYSSSSGDDPGIYLAYSGETWPAGWRVVGNLIVSHGDAPGIRALGVESVIVSANTIRVGDDAPPGRGTAGVSAYATRDMESVQITGNAIEGYAVGVRTALNGDSEFRELLITDNTINDYADTPVADTGIRIDGAADQYLATVMANNIVGDVYPTPDETGSVLIRTGGSPSRPQYLGTGSPEGVVAASVGATYQRRDGTAGESFYVKESGTGDTGWVAR